MKIDYEPRKEDRFGLGWARTVRRDGVEYRINVRPGKRVRLAYSNKYGYHWWATVYRTGEGEVMTLPCDKTTGAAPILEEALYREFCVRAFGRLYDNIEGMLYDRAYRTSMGSPERAALALLRGSDT